MTTRGRYHGTRFDVVRGDVIGDSIYYTGGYEAFTTNRLLEIAKQEGGLFVDVGANVGYYSILWCAVSPANRCIAVEASPRNVNLMRKNVEQNAIGGRCRLEPVAASNADGWVSFDQGPLAQTGWGGISTGVGSGSRVIVVPAKRLDEIVGEEGPIRLLKIDVEGAEALVLEGAMGLLERHLVGEIWFEDNWERREKLHIKADRLVRPLAAAGYELRTSTSASRLPMPYVARPAPWTSRPHV